MPSSRAGLLSVTFRGLAPVDVVRLAADSGLMVLEVVLPRLAHVHVYHWLPGASLQRRPLGEGEGAWRAWMARIAAAGKNPDYLLEFVREDDPANLAADAASLRSWIG